MYYAEVAGSLNFLSVFGTDTNKVTLITRDRTIELPLMPKREVADRVLDHALNLSNPAPHQKANP